MTKKVSLKKANPHLCFYLICIYFLIILLIFLTAKRDGDDRHPSLKKDLCLALGNYVKSKLKFVLKIVF